MESTVMMRCACFCALMLFHGVCSNGAPGTTFYVATNGNDKNNGTVEFPFATLSAAQNAIIELISSPRGLPAGGVAVLVRAGAYPYQAASLSLTAQDSGTQQSPIVYGGYPGETALLSGGVPVKFGKIQVKPPVPVPPQTLVCNVTAFGVSSFGQLANTNNKLELFYEGQAMTLARYPNQGFDTVAAVPKDDNGLVFSYSGTRPSLWTNASDLWLHGYWMWDWRDIHVHVQSIDTAAQQFHIDPATNTGGIRVGERYYAENLLEELDSPGEYYLDRSTGLLYFYPPDDGTGDAWVSVAENVIGTTGTSWVTFQNFQIMHARGTGISIGAGSNIMVTGSTVANHGQAAVALSASYSAVSNCEVYGTGQSGIVISVGDRASLTPGKSSVVGNNIHDFARWLRTYEPGVGFAGVGNYIGHNNISWGPHSAILGTGNDFLIEYNNIDWVCYETCDAGAFYTGRSWAQRGNVLQYNTFANVYDHMPTVSGAVVQAIYLDDQMSGWQVLHNTVINCTHGIFIGGGRDTVVFNNTLINVTVVDVPFDNRGMNWQSAMCQPGGQFEQELISFNYQHPPWSVHYPNLVNIMNEHPCVPVNNTVEYNTYCGPATFTDQTQSTIESWMSTFADNKQVC